MEMVRLETASRGRHVPQSLWETEECKANLVKAVRQIESTLSQIGRIAEIAARPFEGASLDECLRQCLVDDEDRKLQVQHHMQYEARLRLELWIEELSEVEQHRQLSRRYLAEIDDAIAALVSFAIVQADHFLTEHSRYFSEVDPECGVVSRELALIASLEALGNAMKKKD